MASESESSISPGKNRWIVGTADQNTDEKKFNDTLKRMLKTPPKPHEKRGTKPTEPKNIERDSRKLKI